MVKLRKFNCINLKDKEIFVKYFENLGYSIDKQILEKVKVYRKLEDSTKVLTFVINDEALVLEFDNDGNLTKTKLSITHKGQDFL